MKINFKRIIKKLIRIYPFIFLSIIVVYSTRKFLFKGESIVYGEFFGSTDYLFFIKELVKGWGTYNTFGHSNIGLTTSYGQNPIFWIVPPGFQLPIIFLLFLSQLIIGSLSVKFYLLLSLILPFLGMYFFARYWFKKLFIHPFLLNSLSYLSALIYSINVIMGDRISAGHLKYNLAHGLFPLLFLITLKTIDEKNDRLKILFLLFSGLLIGTLIWLMPHLLSLYIIVMAFYIITFSLFNIRKTAKLIVIIALSALIGILLNIHVWLPSLFYKEELAYIADPTYISGYVYNLSHNIKFINIIALVSGFEQNFLDKSIYGNIILLKYILPLLAVIGLIFNNQKKKSLFLFLVGLTGLIFSMGINYPFEKIYKFLFENIFLFRSFREPGKFAILYLFSISLLIPQVFFYTSRFFNKKILFLLLILFTFYILHINPNFTSGNFGNAIIPFKLPKKYQILNEFLSKKVGDYRVAVYPNDQYIGNYSWISKSTNGAPFANIFLLFPLSKNLAISNRTITDWSSRYLDYVESNLDKPWAIARLGEEMVRYIIIDHSLSNHTTYIDLLKNNPMLKKTDIIDDFTIFEIKNYNQKIIKEKPAVYYYGDIKGIKNIPPNITLINIALNSSQILSKNYSDSIILSNASLDEAFFATLKSFHFSFFPEIRFSVNPSKEFYSPGEYLRDLTLEGITFYNPEIIGTIGKNKITKKSNLQKGKYKILLSSLSSENFTNSLRIKVNNQSLIKTDFRKKSNTFEWTDFGEIEIKKDKSTVTIENLEDKTLYVDYLLIIPSNQYKKLQKNFYSAVKSKKIITLKESEILDVGSLKQNEKSIYIFSQSFSPYWKMCDSSVFRVNFYGTGVVCDNNTNIKPKYIPEFLYKISIMLTGLFYFVLFFYIIRLIKKYD